MKKMKKMNNKGFSLVELIVVMAIMAILAITITPRLTQYIDKARQTNDREIPNAVYTAVKLALLDTQIQQTVTDSAGDTIDWTAGEDILDTYYSNTAGAYDILTTTLPTVDAFASEILQVLGDSFTFQSNLAASGAHITVSVQDAEAGLFTVVFNYDGETSGTYTMNSATAN